MAWNGSGATVCGKRRVGIPILGPAVHLQQKIAGPAGRWRRRRGSKSQAASRRPNPYAPSRRPLSPAVRARRHSACTCPASDSRRMSAKHGRRRMYRAACARDRSASARIRGNRGRRRPSGTSRCRQPRAWDAPSLRKISSQYTQRLVTMRTLRLAEGKRSSTAMVLGLPAGIPMSSFTVIQWPRGVLHLQVRHDEPALALLRGGAEGAAVGPIHPAVEQQHGVARPARRLPKSSSSVCGSATPNSDARETGPDTSGRAPAGAPARRAPRHPRAALRIDAPLRRRTGGTPGTAALLNFSLVKISVRGGMVHGQKLNLVQVWTPRSALR